jgi:TPP-dependent pyruvate/acetoin dehydrogenase alpha subunit
VANVADRAAAYGIPGIAVDGNDVEAVQSVAAEAVSRARTGGGPTLVECKTYRYSGHSRSDPGNYQSREEVAFWKSRDPLALQRARLLDRRLAHADEMAAIDARVQEEIEAAVAYARQAPEVEMEAVLRNVYWEGGV